MPDEILASPINIGKKTAPNRWVNHPMECNDSDEFGNPTELTFKRYRKLAEGAAGMITVESLTVSYRSRARKNQLQITERNAQGLARLVKEMREINERSLIIFQINHSGNLSNGSFSEVVSYYPTADPTVSILSDEDVEQIKQWFVDAALIAYQVGADGIDFKQCHGYLCGQLLRPANTKQGRFGGNFENRTRFFRETSEQIKKKIRDERFILGTRVSVYEGIIGGIGTAGADEVAEDLTEPLAFARMIEESGFHFINVSSGIPVFTGEVCRPTRHYPIGVFRHFTWTQAMRGAVKIPVIGTGYSYLRDGKNKLAGVDPTRRTLLYWAEKNLKSGSVDLIGIGRQSLADPLFAKKILAGNLDDINYCKACGGCSKLLQAQARVGCTVYDDFYKEELRRIKRGAL
ncbi:MAG: 2,4-dienoyl-CoA reductase [Deltaproteobacteria bacterium]|nr:2,4-dienoyl-CoA reductase [Deltaproteobacteria bacterium]MBW2152484.1 2,4-dienoyl-CoA reductase [Deltaproteobacteria bacterium]